MQSSLYDILYSIFLLLSRGYANYFVYFFSVFCLCRKLEQERLEIWDTPEYFFSALPCRMALCRAGEKQGSHRTFSLPRCQKRERDRVSA